MYCDYCNSITIIKWYWVIVIKGNNDIKMVVQGHFMTFMCVRVVLSTRSGYLPWLFIAFLIVFMPSRGDGIEPQRVGTGKVRWS